jgi:hypothetical protein
MAQWRCVVVVALMLGLCAGCAHRRPPRPRAVRPAAKPWIATRSLCIFPMARTPARPEPGAMAAAMAAGYRSRLEVPDGAELVRIDPGPRAGHFGSVHIDLSDVRVNPEDKVKKLNPLPASQGTVTADRFELVADPFLLEKARLFIGLTATDAKLDVRRDRQGRSMLTLTDAREGVLTLEVPRRDVDWMLLHAARAAASKYGVSVDRTNLKLDIDGSRTIRVDLKIDTRVGFLPAGLRFRARVDIDDQLNGTMTRLSCDGDQMLGPIVSSIIDPFLRKYEGISRPLVGFDWGQMTLRDVTMDTTDAFKLEAKFGTDPTRPKATLVERKKNRKKRAA